MDTNKVVEKMNALIKRNEELGGAFKTNQGKVKEILDLNQKITNEFIYNSGAINNFKEILGSKPEEETKSEGIDENTKYGLDAQRLKKKFHEDNKNLKEDFMKAPKTKK
jgi:hypothetical protein